MFFHLGENYYIDANEIIMIMDIKSALTSKISRDFIDNIKAEKGIKRISAERPKSIIITREKISGGHDVKAYYSSISSNTLLKRSHQYDFSSFEMEVI